MTNALAEEVVRACREALGGATSAALHEPMLGASEAHAVNRCVVDGWVSSAGPRVDEFEAALAQVCGAAHAVALVNGTAALHVALLAAGVRAGDEVIVPALTFVATANAVRHCGAIPHFADCEPDSLGLDTDRLQEHLQRIGRTATDGLVNRDTGRRIAAVVPMHVFGHFLDPDALVAVCERFGMTLLEDAAEALGSRHRGRHAGTVGRAGVLSFNGNKIVTTGGGGAVLTADCDLATRVRHIATTARVAAGWHFVHDEVGYNYRMPSLNAALGVAQLSRLPEFLSRKRALAARYRAAFAGVAGAALYWPPAGCDSNFWLNTLLLDSLVARDAVLTALNAAGYQARPAWTPLHTLRMYQDCPRMDLPIAEALWQRIVNLPSSAFLAPAP